MEIATHFSPMQEVPAKIVEAKVFFKLNTHFGFWRVVPSPKSQNLTMITTLFVRYRSKMLPFDITSAREVSHRKISEILEIFNLRI